MFGCKKSVHAIAVVRALQRQPTSKKRKEKKRSTIPSGGEGLSGPRHPGCSCLRFCRLEVNRWRRRRRRRGGGASVAAAGPHDHVLVFLEDDVGVVIEEEHRDGVELCGGAARLRHVLGVHQVDLERRKTHQKRKKKAGKKNKNIFRKNNTNIVILKKNSKLLSHRLINGNLYFFSLLPHFKSTLDLESKYYCTFTLYKVKW